MTKQPTVTDVGILASRSPEVENLGGLIQFYPLESGSEQREKACKIGTIGNADFLKTLPVFPTAYLLAIELLTICLCACLDTSRL
jgi:hypothetical protein